MTSRRPLLAALALVLAVFLWCVGSASGQPVVVPIIASTVAGLPGSSTVPRLVTDGSSSSDCTTGGGTTYVWCYWTGAAWAAFGDGGGAGGSGDITAVGDCSTGDCFQATTATHAFMAPAGGGIAAFRAITDADIPDTITVDLATLATTATTANAGDSATSFFGAGTLEHERGGLEGDVSAFGGLVRIAAGSTSAVSTLAGLNTALGSSIADGAHTTDTDTTCLDAGVTCLFAASATEGGAATSVATDAVGTAGLDDDANTPLAGDFVVVETGAASFDYLTPHAGTNVAADLEEETHATEHETGGADAIAALAGEVITTGTVADARIAATISRDSEAPAAGDITGSLAAGYQLGPDVVGAAELADADLGQVAVSGGVVTVEGIQGGTAFPVSPATHDVFQVTDDSAVGACDSAAGSATTLCRWSGAAWVALGDGSGGETSSGTGLQYGDGAGGFSEATSSSVSGADVTLGGNVQLNDLGSVTDPSIKWNQTGTPGFYSSGAFNVSFASNGGEKFRFDTANGVFRAAANQGFYAKEGGATTTAPSIGPANNDTDTGLGLGVGNDLRLIAGGVSGLGVTTSAVTTYTAILQLTPQASAPASCAIGDLYVDTSGAYCGCTATNTWENMTATGSCV